MCIRDSIVVRIGAHIPIPGVDGEVLALAFDNLKTGLFGLFNTFVGGAFSQASLFSLGIMPYISSSIIIQLMGSVIPYFQRLQKEGEAGRKKITQITRYLTVLIAAMQSYGIVAVFLPSMSSNGQSVVINPGLGFIFTGTICLITGVILLMCTTGIKNENKTIAHIAVGLTLLAVFGLVKPFTGAISRGDGIAMLRVIIMISTGILAMVIFIQSFIKNRKEKNM